MLVLPPRFVALKDRCSTAAVVSTLLTGATLVLTPSTAALAHPTGKAARAASDAAVVSPQPAAASSAPDAPVAPLRVLFGGAPLLASPERAPFRDTADGVVYIAPETLEPLGVTFLVDDDDGKVALVGPDGTTSTTVALHRRPGMDSGSGAVAFVPARAVIEALGGKWQENAAANTCCAYTVLTDIQMIGGQLRIKATFPVLPKVTTDRERPDLVIIDFPGTDIGSLPRFLKLDSPNIAQARTGQFSDDTARLVLQMKPSASGPAPGNFTLLGSQPGTQLVLNPGPPNPAITIATTTTKTPPAVVISNNNRAGVVTARSAKPTAPARNVKPTTPPTVIRNVALRSVSNQQMQVVVQAGRAPDVRADLTRSRLTLDIVNATLASASVADGLGAAKHPFLRAAQLLPRGSAAAQLVLDLTRAVNFTVKMLPGGGFILDLMMPKNAGGKLAGKLIVVDPGHGGHDSGARGVDGSREKDVNLQIASKLADTLRDRGANVILTRSNDEFIPVDGRPAIANRSGADFFISIHADSGDYNHSVNGSTIYYHMQVPSCKSLAQCIAERMGDLGTIRCKGPHSDGLQYGGRFVNGYGVLRNSQMVAVLCECGYMSNGSDVRKLNDSANQQRIAEAIANGLRDYVEGNPGFDTKHINPQPVGTLTPLPTTPDNSVPRTDVVPADDNGDEMAPPAATPNVDSAPSPAATPDTNGGPADSDAPTDN